MHRLPQVKFLASQIAPARTTRQIARPSESCTKGSQRRRRRLLGGVVDYRRSWRGALGLVAPIFISVCLLEPHHGQASAFAIKEQSASALGNAFAGAAAAAEDPSYMFFNPAALARQNGTQALSVFTYVRPVFKFNVRDADTATGVTINGGNGGGNVTDAAVIPALYAVFDIDRYVDFLDNFRFGLAVNAPFGLETDYQSGWAGRYQALQTKLKTINVSPTVSFDVLKGLSIGGGLQAQYVDGELSNAIDFGSIGAGIPALAPVANPTHQDGKARVDGDDWGFGWTFGILYEPWNGTRFGAGFRSQISHELDGDARFKLDQQGIGKAISGATGAFTKTGAKVHLETPATLTFGVYHDIDEQWAVMADAAWTQWSSIDEIRIRFKNPAQPDSVTDADWKDTWFFAAGTTYRPTDKWTVRLGAAYDQSPVPNRTRTPRVPDNDRAWVSLGASYQPTDAISFSAGYAHIFGKDASVKLEANDPGNQARGNLSGNVDAFVDILGVQFRWTF